MAGETVEAAQVDPRRVSRRARPGPGQTVLQERPQRRTVVVVEGKARCPRFRVRLVGEATGPGVSQLFEIAQIGVGLHLRERLAAGLDRMAIVAAPGDD